MCVLTFCTTYFLSENFLIRRRTKWDTIINVLRYLYKVPFFLSDVSETWVLLTDFRKITKCHIPWKSVQWEPSFSSGMDRQTDGQTDRRTDRQIDRQTQGRTDRHTDGKTDRQTGTRTDREIDTRTDRQIDVMKIIVIFAIFRTSLKSLWCYKKKTTTTTRRRRRRRRRRQEQQQ